MFGPFLVHSGLFIWTMGLVTWPVTNHKSRIINQAPWIEPGASDILRNPLEESDSLRLQIRYVWFSMVYESFVIGDTCNCPQSHKPHWSLCLNTNQFLRIMWLCDFVEIYNFDLNQSWAGSNYRYFPNKTDFCMAPMYCSLYLYHQHFSLIWRISSLNDFIQGINFFNS